MTPFKPPNNQNPKKRLANPNPKDIGPFSNPGGSNEKVY
jgi:hypothetical protein